MIIFIVLTGMEDNSTEYVCLDSVNNTHIYSLAMNHSDMAARFLVGELQVTMADDCTVSNISFSYHDYSNETGKLQNCLFMTQYETCYKSIRPYSLVSGW